MLRKVKLEPNDVIVIDTSKCLYDVPVDVLVNIRDGVASAFKNKHSIITLPNKIQLNVIEEENK